MKIKTAYYTNNKPVNPKKGDVWLIPSQKAHIREFELQGLKNLGYKVASL